MRALIVAVTIALIAACTESSDPSNPPHSVPSAAPSSNVPSPSVPEEPLLAAEPSPWRFPSDERRDHPTSADVAVGQPQSFDLYTHCGIDFRVDFDNSFWQSYAGDTTAATDPFQAGTMTLLSEEVAVFRFKAGGDPKAVFFVRNDSPKPRVGCD